MIHRQPNCLLLMVKYFTAKHLSFMHMFLDEKDNSNEPFDQIALSQKSIGKLLQQSYN